MKTLNLALILASLLASGCHQRLTYLPPKLKDETVKLEGFKASNYSKAILLNVIDPKRGRMEVQEREWMLGLHKRLEQNAGFKELLHPNDLNRIVKEDPQARALLDEFNTEYRLKGYQFQSFTALPKLAAALKVDAILMGRLWGWPHPRPDGLNHGSFGMDLFLLWFDAKSGKLAWTRHVLGNVKNDPMPFSGIHKDTVEEPEIARTLYGSLCDLATQNWPR